MPTQPAPLTVLAAVTTVAAAAQAQVIFSDGSTSVISEAINDPLRIEDSPAGNPTTVILTFGADLRGSNSSDNSVVVFGSSSVVLAGGRTAQDVRLRDLASLRLSRGEIADDLEVDEDSRAIMTGGSVADDVEVTGNAVFTIFGGSIGQDLEVFGATAFVHGGQLAANGVGLVDTGLLVTDGGLIVLFGSDFRIDGAAAELGLVSELTGTLSGTLVDGTSFDALPFVRSGGEILLAPAPASAAAFACVGGAVARRRRS